MSIPLTIFKNNDEASHALLNYINHLNNFSSKYTLRPYNQYQPEFSEWWLFPKKGEWPAYRYSKLFFHKYQPISEDYSLLHMGYYVEKGLGQKISQLPNVKKNQIMQPDWYWFEFIDNCHKRKYDSTIQQIIEAYPLTIIINAYAFNAIPEPDKERPLSNDSIMLSINEANMKTKIIKEANGILKPLNSHTDDLMSFILELEVMEKDLQFFWIDLMIGVLMNYGSPSEGNLGSSEIWETALKPWSRWIG